MIKLKKIQKKGKIKSIIIISAHSLPMASSAAAHMSDLAEYLLDDHKVYYITQSRNSFGKKTAQGILFGLKNPFIRSKNIYLRLLGEIFFPFFLTLSFGLYCRIFIKNYNIIAYSPTALQWPLMAILKKKNNSQLLIVRDLFPEWLLDSKILDIRSYKYLILQFYSHLQYYFSNIIGVQVLDDKKRLPLKVQDKTVVINSFYSSSQNLKEIVKSGKCNSFVNFGCFGTFGQPQDWKKVIDIIDKTLKSQKNIRFYFYGSNNPELKKTSFSKSVQSQIFVNDAVLGHEFEKAITSIDIGFFSLLPEITSANIPGKFVNYCKYGIPTFALGNINSNISTIIGKNKLGCMCNINNTQEAVKGIINISKEYKYMDKKRIRAYFIKNHSIEHVGMQIKNYLNNFENIA